MKVQDILSTEKTKGNKTALKFSNVKQTASCPGQNAYQKIISTLVVAAIKEKHCALHLEATVLSIINVWMKI